MSRVRKKNIGVESVDNNDRQRFPYWLMLGELLNVPSFEDGSKPLYSGKDIKNWFRGFPYPDSTDLNAQHNYCNALSRFKRDYCLPEVKRRVKGLTTCGGEFLLSIKQEQELMDLIQSEFFNKDIKLSNTKFALLLKDHFASAPDHEFNKYNFTASWMDHFVFRHNATGRMVFQTVAENTEVVVDLAFLERVLTPVGLEGVLKLQNERGISLFQTGVNATPGLPCSVIRCNAAISKAASDKQQKTNTTVPVTKSVNNKRKKVAAVVEGDVVQVKAKRCGVKTTQKQLSEPMFVEPDGVSNLHSPFNVLVDLTPETTNAQQYYATLTNASPPSTGSRTENVLDIFEDDEFCNSILVNAHYFIPYISSYCILTTTTFFIRIY
jgi:hypothetical protein